MAASICAVSSGREPMWRAVKEPDGSSSARLGSARSFTGWTVPAAGCAQPSAAGGGGSRGSNGGAGAAAAGELVVGGVDRAAVDALGGQLGELAGQLAQRAGDGDAEHALAAGEQVDDLLGGGALVDRGAVGEQRDVGEVLDPAVAQVVDGLADVLQGDAGVEQPLDDLEHEDVAE